MALLQLDYEIEYDFEVIAISSNQKPHTLSWEINRMLETELVLQDAYTIKSKKRLVEFRHYKSESENFKFDLLHNKNQNDRLVPELSTVDYFLKYYDDESPYSNSELVSMLRKSRLIQAVYLLEIENLKSKQVLIFE